ncbi:hypothetical protein BDZ45DRAFT_676574 [Acephala macrosclerotiorum]|nr:hypothetical protein BDZ45DRAFT_676574 [Acephala macrosclerotiorum]
MYDRTPSPAHQRKGSLQIPEDEHDHEDRASSMEVGDEDEEDDIDAGLRERRERLERAARLLERGKAKRKEDEMRKNGEEMSMRDCG